MSDEVRVQGLTIANSVVEKVVTMAAQSVDGVASVGAMVMPGFVHTMLGTTQEPFVMVAEDGQSLIVRIHLHAFYGKKLVEVANNVRAAVADAVNVQIGVNISRVDVFVDGITFVK